MTTQTGVASGLMPMCGRPAMCRLHKLADCECCTTSEATLVYPSLSQATFDEHIRTGRSFGAGQQGASPGGPTKRLSSYDPCAPRPTIRLNNTYLSRYLRTYCRGTRGFVSLDNTGTDEPGDLGILAVHDSQQLCAGRPAMITSAQDAGICLFLMGFQLGELIGHRSTAIVTIVAVSVPATTIRTLVQIAVSARMRIARVCPHVSIACDQMKSRDCRWILRPTYDCLGPSRTRFSGPNSP
jgi:hypothetical protein